LRTLAQGVLLFTQEQDSTKDEKKSSRNFDLQRNRFQWYSRRFEIAESSPNILVTKLAIDVGCELQRCACFVRHAPVTLLFYQFMLKLMMDPTFFILEHAEQKLERSVQCFACVIVTSQW